MVIANSAAYFISSDVHVFFRIISSLAAPLFIFLAGANLFFSNEAHFKKFLIRGAYLFVTAVSIDVLIWGIIPFATFDVLYLISFGIIICGLLRFGSFIDLLLGTTFILSSFLLKSHYRFELEELRLFDKDLISSFSISSNLKRLLIDGWFPILPWIGFMFLGRWTMSILKTLEKRVMVFSFLFFISTFYLLTHSSLNSIRNNYIEIFYPVNELFVLMSLAFLILAISVTSNLSTITFFKLGSKYLLGRKSLLVYILHCFLIATLADIFPIKEGVGLFIFCILQLGVFYLFIWVIELVCLKNFISNLSRPIKLILGL
jgi:uncharacterized membrane protein